jgi:succinate dehydrogenase/fumarate reductase flavoprotein subunit
MEKSAEGLSRRSFLKGGAAAAVAMSLNTALAGCATADDGTGSGQGDPADGGTWDKEVDVIIMGYGYGGACAAVSALKAGATALILEKAPEGSGNSAVAVGTMHTSFKVADKEKWIESRIEQLMGTVPDATVREFVEYELTMPEWLEDELGMEVNWVEGLVKGGVQTTMGNILIGSKPGNGKALWEFFASMAEELGAEVMLQTPVKSLVQVNGGKEVIGVIAEQGGKQLRIKANKGVVLACGGYENNPQMQAEYHFPGIAFVPWGTPYNTGDGVSIAQRAGAAMWHFSCFEYAGLTPKKPYDELDDHPVFSLDYNNRAFYAKNKAQNSFLVVNKDGRRFFNENMGIGHQKSSLPFNEYDEPQERYVNYPFFFVCDDAQIKSAPLAPVVMYGGNPCTYAGEYSSYEWSVDNSAEIEKGWIAKGETLAELAGKLSIDPDGLAATVAAFNGYAEAGVDGDFARPAESMQPLLTPPFYATECLISVINTMGGAERNAKSEVLDYDGNPIPRLYSAGQFGSLNGGILYAIGNICEAIASGRRAGDEAAALESQA